MDNNNSNIENEEGISSKKNKSCLLLQDLVAEYEEQLYEISFKIKSISNLIKSKEAEISEAKRTNDHNNNLFSPYNQASDIKVLYNEIENIQSQLTGLQKDKVSLENKIEDLKIAVNCMEEQIKGSESEIDSFPRNTDIGLGILEAQEIERQRIARELHDSTVQNLTSLVHKTELCVKLIDIDSIRAKLELNTMSNTLKMTINDMRGIIYNLKPMTLDDLGLAITVQRYVNRLMNLNNIQVKVTYNEEPDNIIPVLKLTIFRIIQEACTNCIKHAKATFLSIDIKYDEKYIKVVIKDNGIGFDMNRMNKSEQSSSFGISIMRERISLLSGTFDIDSIENMGTTINISVPLEIQEDNK